MRKGILSLALVLLLTGCTQVSESMLQPVDENDTTPYSIKVDSEMTLSEFGTWLDDNKLVATKGTFMNFMREEGLDVQFQPGFYTITKAMSIREIAELVTTISDDYVVNITIPEGSENKEIARIFEKEGLFSAEEFLEALTSESFHFDFLKGVDQQYGYEGYLFPDTYEFYRDASPQEVIEKMLGNFESRLSGEMCKDIKDKGMTLDDVIKLASIIEREGADYSEFPIISSVFHNRLNTDMKLQSCATVQFILEERKTDLTLKEMSIESPYNTYIIEGLPPSPISNPGLVAIEAAIYPAETNYYYFVTKGKGENTHYFAETFEEHEENIKKSGDL